MVKSDQAPEEGSAVDHGLIHPLKVAEGVIRPAAHISPVADAVITAVENIPPGVGVAVGRGKIINGVEKLRISFNIPGGGNDLDIFKCLTAVLYGVQKQRIHVLANFIKAVKIHGQIVPGIFFCFVVVLLKLFQMGFPTVIVEQKCLYGANFIFPDQRGLVANLVDHIKVVVVDFFGFCHAVGSDLGIRPDEPYFFEHNFTVDQHGAFAAAYSADGHKSIAGVVFGIILIIMNFAIFVLGGIRLGRYLHICWRKGILRVAAHPLEFGRDPLKGLAVAAAVKLHFFDHISSGIGKPFQTAVQQNAVYSLFYGIRQIFF